MSLIAGIHVCTLFLFPALFLRRERILSHSSGRDTQDKVNIFVIRSCGNPNAFSGESNRLNPEVNSSGDVVQINKEALVMSRTILNANPVPIRRPTFVR